MKEKFNINQIPDLKQAIIDLPEKEKNQLLIRLINKDQILIEHLHFKLLEDDYDLIKRYEDLKVEILTVLTDNIELLDWFKENGKAKFVLSVIRDLSGRINHFVKVTKNPYYELLLRIYLFIHSSTLYHAQLKDHSVFGEKLRLYQATKLKSMLKLLDKLHDDLKYDISDEFFEAIETICLENLKYELSVLKIDYLQFKSN